MPIIINQHELSDNEIREEMQHHLENPQPHLCATMAVILRHALRDEANRLNIPTEDEEYMLAELLKQEVVTPVVDEAACLQHYEQNRSRFTVGEWAEVEHILFAVTPNAPLEALRQRADATLQELQAQPDNFAATALALSNCPSSAQGGQLGRIQRQEVVPEFGRAVFDFPQMGLLPRLVETRHGLHIVRVTARHAGDQLPFEDVRESIASALHACNQDTAWRQYVRRLVSQANISGIDLPQERELLQ